MNHDESCELLLRQVFEDRDCPPDVLRYLADLSHNIAMLCDGLPLPIVLVAGILRASNKARHEWEYVLEKLNVEYESRHEMVDAILSLSYRHLPHHLRSCLLYLGAFPKDHMIKVSKLTKQLSAQGFLHKTRSLEVQQFVQDLVNRNLVSDWQWDYIGLKSAYVHDRVRDFCLKKVREEKFLHFVGDDNDSDRDLTGSKIKVAFDLDNLKVADDSHTIMCFGHGQARSRQLVSIGKFRLLKSLNLARVEFESFPGEILNLFLLRLLALGYVPELPPSISNLQYLETLIINSAKDDSKISSMANIPRILCLPFEIWTISRLRHMVSFCCGALPCPNKQENSPLENLETLSAVMNLDCSEDLIEMIPNVEKLVIFYFGVERATYSIEKIERLRRLHELKVWVMVPFSAPQDLNLGFPTMLRKLTLRGIRLSHRDMSVISRLPRLQVLRLRRNDFEGDEWRIMTGRGRFEMLGYLLLEELSLRRWLFDGGIGSVFPMLQTIAILTCNELNEIERVVENIPSLGLIGVVGCKNKSLVESARRIKQSNENIEVSITE